MEPTRKPRRPAIWSRRQFLSRTAAGGVLLTAPLDGLRAPTAAAASTADRAEGEVLRRAFREPPPSAKPMTRWWWFGGAVTPAEITRELTFMRDAGLRGAEIQPVYPVAVDDPDRGIRHLRYFSAEWFEVLRHAVREARRLGLQLDFTLGSGWPYGGPFVGTDLASRRLRVLSQQVVGPRTYSWHLTPQLVGEDRMVAVVAVPVLPTGEPDLARAVALTDQPRQENAYNIRTEAWIRDWSVPDGVWRLMVFLDSPTGMQVKRPTLGMEGNVLDHHGREALPAFLRAAGDRVFEALRPAGDPPFHSVFCDSLEVYGADWTSDLPREFRDRRGYDLVPYLPALWHESGPLTPHVRFDYHLTASELILERFFRPLVAWSEAKGVKARIQAHGAMGDVMQGYGLAHIPEGENIFLGDRYMVNLRHRRLASSAAHLYGKPLVSAETYTWLRTPLFTTTLEMMKAATDSVFLDGMNHVVNHGYSYSPPEAGEPGWAFYASTEINHTNTWWRHYPHLARYVQRTQALLQLGVSVNPVAVYLPLADIWAEYGAGGLHVDNEIEHRIDPELLPGLRRAGYDFDLIHDHALATLARVADGHLEAGTGRYRAVMVPGARFMPPESLERMVELARSGGHVIFIERLPEGTPGLRDRAERDGRLQNALAAAGGGARLEMGRRVFLGRGSFTLVPDRAGALTALASEVSADFRIVSAATGDEATLTAARENVGFLHRKAGIFDYYMVANVSPVPHDLRVQFAVGHRSPERWDTETGTMDSDPVHAFVESSSRRRATEVALRLEPFESCFVVFGSGARVPLITHTDGPGALRVTRSGNRTSIDARVARSGFYTFTLGKGGTRRLQVSDVPSEIRLDGPWSLRLGEGPPQTLGQLGSWAELPAGRSFSGWGHYDVEFDLPQLDPAVEWLLDLGRVHETAEVTLNGQSLGAAWKGRRRLACTSALRLGRNQLRVDVANLWIHHAVNAPPPPEWKAVAETFGIRWGVYGEVKPEKLPPAGLLGPVLLVPHKRVTVSL